jgi:hypothetical protein
MKEAVVKLHRGAWSLAVACFVSFGLANADTPILFHHDISAEASWAKVHNSSGGTIAAFYYLGALPAGYTGNGNEDVPTSVLGELRDDLVASGDPEADEAEDFVKSLMGAYANTPVGQIPWNHETTIVYEDHDSLEEACKKTRIAPE